MAEINKSAQEYREEYLQKKNTVLSLLDKTIAFYEEENSIDKVEALSNLKQNVQNGIFSIVVVGEFSVGKSTLLNALMQKRILPSFSSETTATVNFLRHKEHSDNGCAGRVFYNDGSTKDLENTDLETIEKYVSTKGSDVASNVKHLDLYLESDFLKDNVTLVDSPGLNGLAAGHREITERQILESHASIFLFTSKQPGRKSDFEFIHELRTKVNTIIFVLNQIDDIHPEEGQTVEDVTNSIKKSFKNQFENAKIPEIWPVSARNALRGRDVELGKDFSEEQKKGLITDSRIEDFESRLMSFLTKGEKTKEQLLAPLDKILSVVKETRDIFKNEVEVLSTKTDTTEIENKISDISEVLKQLENQLEQNKLDVGKKVSTVLEEIQYSILSKIDKQAEKQLAELDRVEDLDELNVIVQNFESKFISRIKMLAQEQDDDFRYKLNSLVQLEYMNQSDEIIENINSINSDVQLSIDNHFSNQEYALNISLKDITDKVKSLENQLQEAQEKADKITDDFMAAKIAERKVDEIKSNIRSLNDSKDVIESQMLPPIERYTEEVFNKRTFTDHGFLGWIWTGIFGEKRKSHMEQKIDSKAYDDAKARQDSKIQEKENQINELKEELQNLVSENNTSPETLDLKRIKQNALVNDLREKITQENEIAKKEIEEKYKSVIKRCKYDLEDYCDIIATSVKLQISKHLRESKQNYTTAIMNILESNLKVEINEKKDYLESLKHQINASETDRNNHIELLQKKIADLNQLLEETSDFQAEVIAINADVISEEV